MSNRRKCGFSVTGEEHLILQVVVACSVRKDVL